MSKDVRNNHATTHGEVVAPDDGGPGAPGFEPTDLTPPSPHFVPAGEGNKPGSVMSVTKKDDTTVTTTIDADGCTVVIYDVVNPPGHVSRTVTYFNCPRRL